MIALQILIVTVLVVVNAFFVAAEFAIVKLRMSQIEPMARQGKLTARAVASILKNLNAYLSACQLGITLASLGLGWVGEPVVAELLKPCFALFELPPEWVHYISLPFAFIVITFLHITLGEQAPKILAIQKERPTALACALPLQVFYYTFKPVIWAINGTSNLILRAMGLRLVDEHGEAPSADELRMMVAETIAGEELRPVEKRVMKGIIEFYETTVRQIMVPRPDIVFMDTNDSLEENIRVALESGRTRFPLCKGHLDDVIGMIHARDLLEALSSKESADRVESLKRDLLYLPETITLNTVLLNFQRARRHMALIVDEFGGVAGLVTLEDVLEEIVGQIQDEFDEEEPLIIRKGKDGFLVNGKCPLDDLVEKCSIDLPDVKADTAGGLVTELIGHIPRKGETVEVGGYCFLVLDAVPTRINHIEIRRRDP